MGRETEREPALARERVQEQVPERGSARVTAQGLDSVQTRDSAQGLVLAQETVQEKAREKWREREQGLQQYPNPSLLAPRHLDQLPALCWDQCLCQFCPRQDQDRRQSMHCHLDL
jgi:hypothetical protein